MAHISPSATRIDLTYTVGGTREGTPAFFRVVPADNIQGPTDATYMVNTLKVKKVVVFDFQEPYSQGLAAAVTDVPDGARRLRDPAVGAEHDDGLLVVRDEGPERRRRRLLPDAAAAGGTDVRRAARRAGQEGRHVPGDGSNTPSQYNKPGGYVSNFAPDITGITADAAIIAAWKKANPGQKVGSFGPPTYGAVQVMLNAIKLACDEGARDAQVARRRLPSGQEGADLELDPRRELQVLDEDQRPAERQVLHLQDPA